MKDRRQIRWQSTIKMLKGKQSKFIFDSSLLWISRCDGHRCDCVALQVIDYNDMMIISFFLQDLVSIDSRETAQLILKVFAHSLADIVRKLEVSSTQ